VYLVVVNYSADNKITKLQEYETRAEADSHVGSVIDKYPKAFVIDNPPPYSLEYTTVDPINKILIYDKTTQDFELAMNRWEDDMIKTDSFNHITKTIGISRDLEQHIKDVHGGNAGTKSQPAYDAKIFLRNKKPTG